MWANCFWSLRSSVAPARGPESFQYHGLKLESQPLPRFAIHQLIRWDSYQSKFSLFGVACTLSPRTPLEGLVKNMTLNWTLWSFVLIILKHELHARDEIWDCSSAISVLPLLNFEFVPEIQFCANTNHYYWFFWAIRSTESNKKTSIFLLAFLSCLRPNLCSTHEITQLFEISKQLHCAVKAWNENTIWRELSLVNAQKISVLWFRAVSRKLPEVKT